ncbi:MAG TPA: hypothetical protein VMJ32_07370, partial [Pirellulales bacterium]|nr:hypothetical protein [Pirellulales bacterium]
MFSSRSFRVLGACAVGLLLACSCQTFQIAPPVSQVVHAERQGHGDDLEVCKEPTVEALAHDLDKLEGHIEKYGSVVAKQPDVWGQARLTRYREEFEQQMASQLTSFATTLQGAVSESDQAYFADAFALSAAASPRGRAAAKEPATTSSSSSSSAPSTNTTSASPSPSSTSTSNNSSGNLAVPELPDAFGAFSNISRNPVGGTTPPLGIQFADAKTGIQLEPTVILDERARFLNHLQELRRINEGDDTADAPGYSLNLVRIPMSVLPGKYTDIGFGAEATCTMQPYLSEDLLPTTFRNLVMNDMIDQLAFPITDFINRKSNKPYFRTNGVDDIDQLL